MDEPDQGKQLNPLIPRVRLGTPAHRGTGITELRLIAMVNEAIKQAIGASENISLIAVNASLVARRAGSGAEGYCVVAGELRVFSERMAKTMQGWSELIFALVRETARSRNQARYLAKLRATGKYSDKAQQAISAAYMRNRHTLALLTQENSVRVIELQSLIRRTEKQRVTGEVIARSAMIESAYGGEMRVALQQVAKEIDAGIASFTAFSQQVAKQMNEVAA
ncbi:MAG TPA: hypothetical protein VFW53_12025 [Gallionella sp.]|nr:hypothetical protein [Gallionella sp.]